MTMLGGVTVDKDASKLATAAEDLIKAACSHAESESLAIGKETVENLKKLSSDTSSIEKSVGSLNASHDAKMGALNKSIADLKQEITKLNSNLTTLTKKQTLEWAISNAEVNSFKHYTVTNSNSVSSAEIVKIVLLFFREGRSAVIKGCSMTPYNAGNIEAGEKLFRDALTKQVHRLNGQKPRIALEGSAFIIHYS